MPRHRSQRKWCTTKNGALLFAALMVLYSFLHICSFLVMFYNDKEPDWVMLFKLMCDFILLPSSTLLVIGIRKDNLTIVLLAEGSFLSTSFGFLLYTMIFLILFTKHGEFGIGFFTFIAQRIFFFALEYMGSLNLHRYRHTLHKSGDEDDWCCNYLGLYSHKPEVSRKYAEGVPSDGYNVQESRERLVPFNPSSGNLKDACGIERQMAYSSSLQTGRTMPVFAPGQAPCAPERLPESDPKLPPRKKKGRKNDYIKLKNAPSALKFLKPCPRPTPGFEAPFQFTGQECFKNLEGGRQPGTGAFGSSSKYSGYPPIRGCQSCGGGGGTTWQSKGTLKLSSGRPISAADLEGIRNIRGLGIGFPGSLGLCKDMPGPGTYGGTYTARQTPSKGAASVPKCY